MPVERESLPRCQVAMGSHIIICLLVNAVFTLTKVIRALLIRLVEVLTAPVRRRIGAQLMVQTKAECIRHRIGDSLRKWVGWKGRNTADEAFLDPARTMSSPNRGGAVGRPATHPAHICRRQSHVSPHRVDPPRTRMSRSTSLPAAAVSFTNPSPAFSAPVVQASPPPSPSKYAM